MAIIKDTRRNLVINGAFDFWQRGTSFLSAGPEYTADRWRKDDLSSSEANVTRVAWNSSDAGFSEAVGNYYARFSSGNTNAGLLYLTQRIEDVKTAAGKTINISFRAKSSTSETVGINVRQQFGSGGSSDVVKSAGTKELTTEWATYNVSIDLDTIVGKTIGANSYVQIELTIDSDLSGSQEVDYDWIMVVEESAPPPKFERAGFTLGEELRLCQRYYEKSWRLETEPGTSTATGMVLCYPAGSADMLLSVQFNATKRTNPTAISYGRLGTPNRVTPQIGTSEVGTSVNFLTTESGLGTLTVGGTTLDTDIAYRIHWTADAEL